MSKSLSEMDSLLKTLPPFLERWGFFSLFVVLFTIVLIVALIKIPGRINIKGELLYEKPLAVTRPASASNVDILIADCQVVSKLDTLFSYNDYKSTKQYVTSSIDAVCALARIAQDSTVLWLIPVKKDIAVYISLTSEEDVRLLKSERKINIQFPEKSFNASIESCHTWQEGNVYRGILKLDETSESILLNQILADQASPKFALVTSDKNFFTHIILNKNSKF